MSKKRLKIEYCTSKDECSGMLFVNDIKVLSFGNAKYYNIVKKWDVSLDKLESVLEEDILKRIAFEGCADTVLDALTVSGEL